MYVVSNKFRTVYLLPLGYFSIGSRIVRVGGGGARNMKYKVAAIFFMTNFNGDEGGWPLCPSPWIRYCIFRSVLMSRNYGIQEQ